MTHLSIETDDGQILAKIPLSDTYALITDRDGVTIQGVAAEALTPSEALIERAENAEQERDEYRAMHSAQIKTIAELQKGARGFTAEDVGDAMIERALTTYRDVLRQQGYVMTSNDKTQEAMSHALRAALTEPPARPEGAEQIEAVLDRYWSGDIDGDDLADRIAEEMNR